MRWFRDGFCQLEKQIAENSGCDVYDLMNREAEKNPCRLLWHDVHLL
mgnify:FL=1